MLTALGKTFTIVMVAFSVFALGVALWVAADPVYVADGKSGSPTPSMKAKLDKLDNEIRELTKQKDAELLALNEVVAKLRIGNRPFPGGLNAANPFGQPGQDKSVDDIKKEIRALTDEDKKLFDEWNRRQTAVTTLINDLDIARQQVRASLAEQKKLREQIESPSDGALPFRERTAAAFAAKQEAEKRQESLKPVLVNETLKLMGLMKRNEILEKRAGELAK